MKKNLKLIAVSIISVFILISLYSFIIEKNKKLNVYIVGDSTVKNGKGKGDGGLWGWGDPIAFHFDSLNVHVENHALGGTSSRTFQTRGLWQEVLDKVKPGDYVLIQFGHNDGGPYDTGRARASIKGVGDDTLKVTLEESGKEEIIHTYGWYLRKYINDTKAKGGIPVIISPIPRNDWKDGDVIRKENSYPAWAKQVAEQEKVFFIDLHDIMITEMEKCGENIVTGKYFFKKDHTHTSAQGAILNARLVAKGLLVLKKCKLSNFVIENPDYIFPGKIKIIIVGDSTVAKGKDGLQGWGEEIGVFFDTTKTIIINRARGGRSTRTFSYEGLWKEALEIAEPGDYVLMQFGHNDSGNIDSDKMRGSIKGTGNDSIIVTRENGDIEIVHSYGWYLRKFISESKEKGAIPIIFSQIPRREWIKGKVERVNENYGKWAKESADSGSAYFIDLNEIVALKYEILGAEKVAADFFLKDHTHTTKEGAQLNAKSVIEGISELKCCGLSNFVKSN